MGTPIKKMPEDLGKVLFATGNEIKFSCGLTLRTRDRVRLSGGKLGEVMAIYMAYFTKSRKSEINLDIEDDYGICHKFRFPAN